MAYYRGNKWLVVHREPEDFQVTLFCFPYAGGSAAIYKAWAKYLPDTVNLVAIELPRHGSRIVEPGLVDLNLIMHEIIQAAKPLLTKPYLVFGHSMGAILAFEFVRNLRSQGLPIAQHMFLSAQEGARFKHERPKYLLSDPEFIEYLRVRAGTEERILNNQELMNYLLPMLRSDHQLSETYYLGYKGEAPFACPITVFAGTEDDISEEALRLWKCETSNQFNIEYFAGHHLFILQQEVAMTTAINKHIVDLHLYGKEGCYLE